MPLYLFYTMVQKSQKLPKTQIKGGGSCLKSSEFSLVAACLQTWQSGSPRSGKRTDSLVKGENSHAVPVVAS